VCGEFDACLILFGEILGAMSTISLEELMKHPDETKLGEIEFGEGLKRISTPSGNVDVAPAEFVTELQKISPPQ